MALKLKVTLVRSPVNRPEKQKATIRGLGLRKLNRSSVLEDTPSVRGMIRKVQHLVLVEPADSWFPPTDQDVFLSTVREVGRELATTCGIRITSIKATSTWEELWTEFETLASISVRLVQARKLASIPRSFSKNPIVPPKFAERATQLRAAMFATQAAVAALLKEPSVAPGSRIWEIAMIRSADGAGTALLNSLYIKSFFMDLKGKDMSLTPAENVSKHDLAVLIDAKYRSAQALIEQGEFRSARKLLLAASKELVDKKEQIPLPPQFTGLLNSALGFVNSHIGNEFLAVRAYEQAIEAWEEARVPGEIAECHLALAVSYHHYGCTVRTDIRSAYLRSSIEHYRAAETIILELGNDADVGLRNMLEVVRDKLQEVLS